MVVGGEESTLDVEEPTKPIEYLEFTKGSGHVCIISHFTRNQAASE